MDISIIIVSYNTSRLLKNCLDSIKQYTSGLQYEVIVVDNDSKDDTIDMLESQYEWVKLIRSKVNLGFGRANNLAVEHSSGKYLFFLNSDTILLNNAIYFFYEFSEKNSDFGALGSILLDANKSPCHSYGCLMTPLSELKSSLSKYLRWMKSRELVQPKLISEPKEVGYITGADLWVPRIVYDQIGGFDPNFFMYCEETDLQKRMDDVKLKRLIIPGPKIIHLEGGSDPSYNNHWSPSRISNLLNSRKIYYAKHFNKKILPIFYTIQFIIEFPWKIIRKLYK